MYLKGKGRIKLRYFLKTEERNRIAMFSVLWSILSAHRSCFLVDLRSFLLVSFVWTENKGAFTVTKKRQRLIPVALFPINYNKFPAHLRDRSILGARLYIYKSLPLRATSLIYCFVS